MEPTSAFSPAFFAEGVAAELLHGEQVAAELVVLIAGAVGVVDVEAIDQIINLDKAKAT